MTKFSARTGVFRHLSKRFSVLSITAMILLLISSSGLLTLTQAAPGHINKSFGQDGKVLTDFFTSNETINAIALQNDGKIIVAGSAQNGALSFNADFALARYNPNGSLDTTFDGDGKVTTGFASGHEDSVYALAIQEDGKILAAGYTTSTGGDTNPNWKWALARYNSDGSLDTTFGDGGKVATDISDSMVSPPPYRERINGLAILNNKIIATGVGIIPGGNHSDFITIRYNMDGSIDHSFGNDGKAITNFVTGVPGGTLEDCADAVFLQDNNTILVVGRIQFEDVSQSLYYGLTSYTADGQPDFSFGIEGQALIDFPHPIIDRINKETGAAVQPDGKIVLGGYKEIDGIRYFAVSRVLTNGALDTTFGDGGHVTTDIPGIIHTLKVQRDGNIIAAGQTAANPSDFVIAQFDSKGVLDETFGKDGIITTDFQNDADRINALAIQRDGRILAAGYAIYSSDKDFAIARYLGSLVDTKFDFDGDALSDVAVWRPSTGTWFINKSADGSARSLVWGTNGDTVVPADYDGDGETDVAVWRPSNGTWYIEKSSNHNLQVVGWGLSADKPVPADYDGDGRTDVAIWRPSNGTWYILKSSTQVMQVVGWGSNGDIPVPGDYDGDGIADVAVWRPSTGTWFIRNSSDQSTRVLVWGTNGDVPVTGDYDDDGKTDVAVWRPSNGTWYIEKSSNHALQVVGWGLSADKPVPADYDGDGFTDVAIWRPSNGTWYILKSSTQAMQVVGWGQNGDVPASGR